MISLLRKYRRKLKHALKGYPIYAVSDWLVKNNYIQNKTFLEAFANTGEHQAPAYYKYASYFEAWEITPELAAQIKENLPNAVVKVTNSIEEITKTTRKFDVIILDAHMGVFGGIYCEHFDILPNCFRIANDEVVIVMNVMPYAEDKWKERYPTVFDEKHLERRKQFYGNALNVVTCTYDEMIAFYKDYFRKNGYEITDYFFHQRHLLHYLAVKATKIKANTA